MKLLDWTGGQTPKDKFAKKVISRIRQRGWQGPEPEYVRAPFSLKLDGERTMFLDNAFSAWVKAQGSDRERQIDIAIGFLFETSQSDSFASATPHLLAAVRNRSHLENAWLTPGMEGARGAYSGAMQVLADGLVVVAVIDSETAISYVTAKTVKDWGVSFDAVMATGLENLRAISPCKFVRDPAGFWVSDFGDHHDASRLLLPHLFEQLDLAGLPVAIPLDRAGLLVAGSEDAPALGAMADFAEDRIATADRPISCAPLILQDGQWAPFKTPIRGTDRTRRLTTLQMQKDYAEQKQQLEERQKITGEDVFIASLSEVQNENDWNRETFAVWGEAIDTLLPRAEVIAFTRGSGDTFEHRPRLWEDVEASFGPFTPEPDLYPPRYRLKSWPDNAWERVAMMAAPAWAPA